MRDENRIHQGDIIKDVHYIESVNVTGETIDINIIEFPYVIILSQDCDLRSDFLIRKKGVALRDTLLDTKENLPSADQILLSVIVAPIYNADYVYSGRYFENIGVKMAGQSRPKPKDGRHYGSLLSRNEIPRFQFLGIRDEDKLKIPDSFIDFKHYFSLSVPYLYSLYPNNLIGCIDDLFREEISHRFAVYLSRIGLPPIVDVQEKEHKTS